MIMRACNMHIALWSLYTSLYCGYCMVTNSIMWLFHIVTNSILYGNCMLYCNQVLGQSGDQTAIFLFTIAFFWVSAVYKQVNKLLNHCREDIRHSCSSHLAPGQHVASATCCIIMLKFLTNFHKYGRNLESEIFTGIYFANHGLVMYMYIPCMYAEIFMLFYELKK